MNSFEAQDGGGFRGMPSPAMFKQSFNSVLGADDFSSGGNSQKSFSGAKQAQSRWNPYSFELGTIAGIKGKDFVVLASDTRLSVNESALLSRDGKKIHALTDKVGMGGCMFYGDTLQLVRVLKARMMQYGFDYREDMAADNVAEMLARTLYGRRFFPYYAWTIVGGIDSKGAGALYSYDPVGCIEEIDYISAGSAHDMVQSFFDNQIGWVTQETTKPPEMTMDRAKSLMKDAFKSATERETCTGDKIHLVILAKGKPVQEEWVQLRED